MKERNRQLLIIALMVAFVAVNAFCVAKEMFIVPLLSAGVATAYLLIFKVEWVMYLMALSMPFAITFNNESASLGLSLPSEALMIMLTGLFFARILYDMSVDKKIVSHPVTIAIFAYLTWILITSITSEIPVVSFKFLASKIWFITSSYFMVLQLMKKGPEKWLTFFNCYAISLAIVVLITTKKSIAIGLNEHAMHWVMEPFYNDHTAYGAVLAFFLPMSIGFIFLPQNGKLQRLFYAALSAIFAVGLYCSFSRAAWLSFVVAIGVWCMVKLRLKFSWIVAGGLIVFSTLFYFQMRFFTG
ncbi:MAG: hypothetical protein J6W84_00460 [Bacteroidales bacterium]|nr:hypothetical protein [Bacteroidales bacterium]